MSQMMRLLEVGRRRIIDCLFWITVFSLRLFLATSAVNMQVNKVIINDDQHTFHCSSSTGGEVWYYSSTSADGPFVNTVDLGDTSYIVSAPNLHITQIKPGHEGYYSCDTDSTIVQLIVLGMPRFVGCFDDSPCMADETQFLSEGDNIRFNISVDYIPGGPLGENQNLRLVSLLKDSILLMCLNTNLGDCVINPTLPAVEQNRIQHWRNASNPWMGIEINITNAVADDSAEYFVELEADDPNAPGIVTQSTSTITVTVLPTLTSLSMSSSISLSSSLDSSSSSSSENQGTGLSPSSTTVRISLSSTRTTSSRSSINEFQTPSSTSTAQPVRTDTILAVAFGLCVILLLLIMGLTIFIWMCVRKKQRKEGSQAVNEEGPKTMEAFYKNPDDTFNLVLPKTEQ